MLRESSELSLTRQPPGMLAPWVMFVIAVACAVTFAAVAVGSALVWDQLPSWIDLGLFRHGLTFFMSFWLLATYLPPWRLARSLRVAVLLPLAHAIVIGCAWPVWRALAPHVLDADAATSFAAKFPVATVTIVTCVAFAAAAAVLARRRSGDWVHGFAMFALAELLLLGLWLPIACSAWPGGSLDAWSHGEPLLAHAGARIAFTVVPPTVIAFGFTAVALRKPNVLAPAHGMIGASIALLLLTAILSRTEAGARSLLLYSNFVPALLCAALVAISSLLALGAVTWRRARRLHRELARLDRQPGTVVDDGDEPAIGLEITSWLRGPRVVQRPFAIRTTTGMLPVRGAHLVAPIPLATTQLWAGEQIAVVEPGGEVEVGGMRAASGDPFRTSAALDADALYVAPVGHDRGGFASAALVMWRPCVAYLLIVSAIALPALAALAGS